MTFTKEEKDFLKFLLKRELEKIKEKEHIPNQGILDIIGEYNYDDFMQAILKKI